MRELNEGLSGKFTISVADHATIIQGLANFHSQTAHTSRRELFTYGVTVSTLPGESQATYFRVRCFFRPIFQRVILQAYSTLCGADSRFT